jgi:hypothetical protein
MRNLAILLLTATSLSACGGGDTQSVSGTAVSSGSAGGSGTTTATDPYAEFVNPTTPRTYQGIGGAQTLQYNTDDRTPTNGTTGILGDDGQQGLSFAANASTVRSSSISLTYDPRDATFTLVYKDPRANTSTQTRFQDPANRTDFLGSRQPQWGTDDFGTFGAGANGNFRYLQAGDGDPVSLYSASGSGFVNAGDNTHAPRAGNPDSPAAYQATNLFYELPGSTGGTRYVGLAGYTRNSLSWTTASLSTGATIHQALWHLERGAFAYGLLTDNAAVPKTGTGTYTGSMIATMIYNPTLDTSTPYPNFFQWLSGKSVTTVNFATSGVTLALTGTVGPAHFDYNTSPQLVTIPQGATFTAAGTATIDLVRTGGFTGQFQSAGFSSSTNGLSPNLVIAGSSIDGAFFGPAAEEVGGGFQIVGGNPDERIHILGAFKGRKP